MHLRSSGNNVAQQRLGALYVDGEIIVDEKYHHLPFFFASARLQKQQFVDHALVGEKANGVPEESSHRAKLATVGPTSSSIPFATSGTRLTCPRSIDCHGITGYCFSDGLRSLPVSSTGV